ncbi:hypothetical protein MVEG_09209 [Podila verticillata NRRL 6337]|nr:hypothetical protein MVEG_09209 [Podila verticillata NRRL 6337]
MAHPHSVSSVDKALAIPELLPKRLLDLFLSRAFREAVLAISAHHLEFDETRIFLKQEQEIFLQVSGGHVHRAKLSADIGMDMDEHNANSLLSKVGQCCPRVKDIVLQVRNASDHTQPDCELATIKTLTSAAKELIYGAKNLETLTLSFEEKAVFFPCQLFLDLAPHAQHVRGLHVMLAEKQLYSLIFTPPNGDITGPRPVGLIELGGLQINILFPCLKTFTITDIYLSRPP